MWGESGDDPLLFNDNVRPSDLIDNDINVNPAHDSVIEYRESVHIEISPPLRANQHGSLDAVRSCVAFVQLSVSLSANLVLPQPPVNPAEPHHNFST